MTPEELIKLCDEADRSGPNAVRALAKLHDLDFLTIARARSYAALWAAGQAIWDADQLPEYLEGPDSDYGGSALAVRKAVQLLSEALATTEGAS